jgi:uncharacterized damage-inducible protein DinB
MISPRHARTMAVYNRWMNERVYAACAPVPDAERKHDRGAFFKSIHGTLNHLLFGDRVWLGRFLDADRSDPNGRFYAPRPDAILFDDFAALRAERAWLDGEIVRWADGLSEAWLAADFTWTSGIDGKTRTFPGWLLATHMFNHQTHHRGQLTTLLSQLGVDPGATDIPWMPGADERARAD